MISLRQLRVGAVRRLTPSTMSLCRSSQRVFVPTVRLYSSRQPQSQPQNDDRMIGPYPHVPQFYYNERPEDIPWDDKQSRRNFGEPLQYNYDLIDVWSPDHFDIRPDSTAARYNLYFIAIIVAFSGFCYWKFEGPNFVRREYLFDGLNKALGGDEKTKEQFQARPDRSA